MSFYVSTLHNLPIEGIEYFVHVIDVSSGSHSRWINENLQTLSASFGWKVGLVAGPRNLSEEVHQFLLSNMPSSSDVINGLFHSATCLLISEGHLAITKKTVYLIPVASSKEHECAQELIEELIKMVAHALNANNLQDFVRSLGAQQLELAAIGSFIVCTLRRLNKCLELKPNIIGLGLNLNEIIEAFLPPERRPI